jgi:hypothetical protein
MHTMNGIYAQQMVEAIRLDQEREQARRELEAGLPRASFIDRLRRLIGPSFIAAGRLIQGRSQPEHAIDPSHESFESAR